MTSRSLLGLAALLVGVSSAGAHFVWIETTAKEGQLLVRSGFGESGGWDIDLVDKIKATKYWARTGGVLEPLALPLDTTEKEYRAKITGKAPSAIIGQCDYGVIQFGNSPASLLRYTAKSLVGAPAAWQDSTPNKDLRIELIASVEGEAVKLQALFLGKPLADAKIKADIPDGKSVEFKTDSTGTAHWPLVGGGTYRCYVGTTTKKPGELDGKKYDVLKDYTSLTFEIGGDKVATKK
ncbi:MAG: hypothetical protein K8U03_06015 [Planctomycetia bacterium]|nr:hypothetical protein [Planctomycetia bacterium]